MKSKRWKKMNSELQDQRKWEFEKCLEEAEKEILNGTDKLKKEREAMNFTEDDQAIYAGVPMPINDEFLMWLRDFYKTDNLDQIQVNIIRVRKVVDGLKLQKAIIKERATHQPMGDFNKGKLSALEFAIEMLEGVV